MRVSLGACSESVKGLPCLRLDHCFFLGRPKAESPWGEGGQALWSVLWPLREKVAKQALTRQAWEQSVACPWRYRCAG